MGSAARREERSKRQNTRRPRTATKESGLPVASHDANTPRAPHRASRAPPAGGGHGERSGGSRSARGGGAKGAKAQDGRFPHRELRGRTALGLPAPTPPRVRCAPSAPCARSHGARSLGGAHGATHETTQRRRGSRTTTERP